MKKELLLGALISVTSFASAKELLEIKITSGIRSEQSEVAIPAHIEVITRQDIEDSGAAHVADVLRGHSTIQLTDIFGDGSRTNLSMRGFGDTANANTLVLVDGRRLNNMDIASPDINSISLKDIERIEIIQGSATVLYGDQAVGGVINIITRAVAQTSASVEVGAGSYNGHRVQAQLAQELSDNFSIRVSGEQRQTNGYREHSELDYENLFGALEFRHASGRLFAEVQSTDEDLHTPGALYLEEADVDRRQARSEYRNDYIDTNTEVFRAGIRQELSSAWAFEGEWTYRESDGKFLQSSRNAAETIPATQRRRVNSFNPRLIGKHRFNGGTLLTTVGYDYDESRYRLSSRFGPQDNDQTVKSWYGQAVIPLSAKVKATLGARHSRVENTVRDGFTFPAGRDVNDDLTAHELGIEYRPDTHWRLFARRADNFRFAKVDEYLNPIFGTTSIIDNQTGRSLEVGAEYQRGDWQLSLQGYDLSIDDEIAFDSTNFGANINLDKTSRQGMAMNVVYDVSQSTSLGMNLNVVDADIILGSFAGNDVPMVASYTARFSVNHQINANWRVHGELQVVDDRPYSGDFDKQLDSLDGYSVANMNVSYERKNWQFGFKVNNLFDKEYADFGARSNEYPAPAFARVAFASIQPSPERNFWLSVRYHFQ